MTMQVRLSRLKITIRELLEAYRKTSVRDTRPTWEKEPRAFDKPEPRKGSLEKGRSATTQSVEDEIEEMRAAAEFHDLDAYVGYKLENDETSYDWRELQALARNLGARRVKQDDAVAGKGDIDAIRKELGDIGFDFVPRQPEKQVRGASSNAHGTHPFAGSGGGGSGFSSDRSGGGFTSFGGGPGTIGSDVKWDPDSPKNLRMGARRRS